jgi:hypothetical protein
MDRDSYSLKLVKQGIGFGGSVAEDSMDFNDTQLSQSTDKWNPLTFAIYSGNLDLIKFIITKSIGETKRIIKIPGIFKTQEVSRLFPFIISLKHSN